MRPILVDTNAYVAFKKNDASILKVIQHAEIIMMSPIVIGELLSGFECGNKAKSNKEELHDFLRSSRVRILNVTSDTSSFYSQIYFSLRSKGKPIPTNDMWIASQALENGCLLCSFDKHFKLIDGLVTCVSLSDLNL